MFLSYYNEASYGEAQNDNDVVGEPVEPLWQAIDDQHRSLPYASLNQLRASVVSFRDALLNGKMRLASGCSGSSMESKVLPELFKYWKENFGVDIQIEHYFCCEHVGWKREFIRDQSRPMYIFENMEDMCKEKIKDWLTGEWVAIECQTFSMLASNAIRYPPVLREERKHGIA